MRKKIVKNLVCPNSGESGVEVFGFEVFRDEKLHNNLNDAELFDTDDIKTGLLIVKKYKWERTLDQTLKIIKK